MNARHRVEPRGVAASARIHRARHGSWSHRTCGLRINDAFSLINPGSSAHIPSRAIEAWTNRPRAQCIAGDQSAWSSPDNWWRFGARGVWLK